MLRYMAFVWNDAEPADVLAAEALVARLCESSSARYCVFSGNGLRVFCIGTSRANAATLLRANQGVVLGDIFERSASGSLSAKPFLGDKQSARIAATDGRELVQNYWGNYVAILQRRDNDSVRVLRGPASSLPCFRTSCNRVEVLCSFVEDCAVLGMQPFTIDWDYVSVSLVANVPTDRTGLREVSQLRPGHCIEIANGHVKRSAYWDPLAIAAEGVIEDEGEAEQQLRRAVRQCVHTWASCHPGIMLSLSGGLDSSIVLACLKDAPRRPQITCVTEYSVGSDSDEREYARAIVRKTDCSMHIEQQRTIVNFEGMFSAARSAVPQDLIRRVLTSASLRQVAQQCQATAIFSGRGGDELFCQHGARSCVADFVYRRGLRPRLGRVAYDAAQVEALSIWRILSGALREGLFRREVDLLEEAWKYQTLITPGVVSALRARPAVDAPWRQSTSAASPGTLSHAYAITMLDDYYDPMGLPGDPAGVAPLLSQPLMEATLRIPSYLLMIGGWDRGLARRAFADELPPEIARRRHKGGMDEFSHDVVQANLGFMRKILMDGVLVEHGLLDRAKVAEALVDRPSNMLGGMAGVLQYLSTEVWARSWCGEVHAAAA
jgi:asparagine synthase (glutamine-hydrolysing)